MEFPNDLKIAYETFAMLCTQKGYTFAGMAINPDIPAAMTIGNVLERGHDFANLLRTMADLLDDRVDAGKLETPTIAMDKVN
jgi:uncharacterized alpha-E superfamily protein